MIDNRFESTDKDSVSGDETEQRRLLELELIKIQNEASAARLDARAAEIELMIRKLSAGRSTRSGDSIRSHEMATSGRPINPPHLPAPTMPASRFGSWDDVRTAGATTSSPTAVVSEPTLHSADVAKTPTSSSSRPAIRRIDGAEPTVNAPHFLDVPDGVAADIDAGGIDDSLGLAGEEPIRSESISESETVITQHRDSVATPIVPMLANGQSLRKIEAVSGEVAIDSERKEDEEESQRGKPAAWLVSAIAHVAVLLILAFVSLQTRSPKDQVALSATAAEANEVSMETFSIESSEPEPVEVTEPTPSETEYELSPVGQIAATDFAPDAAPAPPSPAAAALSSNAMSAAAAMSLKSDSDAKIQFCGVEGGGNHFVYLVDSSGSMGDGFESARAELLASIAILKPDQRFYVVFFDAESDYMRLSNAKVNEPSSVNATPANKAALKRWAMRISKDRGRAPYDPLRFALTLKPDVIFLLSDGEFPQGIEDLLKEENKVENLFGDRNPISIVHTISYHSKEGESRMRRIAEQNKGQYRYVPKP